MKGTEHGKRQKGLRNGADRPENLLCLFPDAVDNGGGYRDYILLPDQILWGIVREGQDEIHIWLGICNWFNDHSHGGTSGAFRGDSPVCRGFSGHPSNLSTVYFI